jgi:Peptidase_C39 like family
MGLRMQYQESHNWCWIAVATSINHFYNPASTATQCGIMTAVGHTVNHFPRITSACPSAQAVASVPGLAAILADPYLPDAENVLDNPALRIYPKYLKTGGVGDALNVHGNWNTSSPASPTLAQVTSEIAAGRPVAVDITWPNGNGHCVAIGGVLDDQLLICDPANGESVISFELFPAAYHGGATLADMEFTQKGT